jgi:hypothetical protein
MTPEKRAELLHYAADHPYARFICKRFFGSKSCTYDIMFVLGNLCDDWEIYHEPKEEVSYAFVKKGNFTTKEQVLDAIKYYDGYTPIKITKSSDGKVKVEVVE